MLPSEFKGKIETEKRDFKYDQMNCEETTLKQIRLSEFKFK